ncbi:hypothetical protein [Priestia koreensis]|uniref:hypothetical protein n=1 Tax=Priestia koreensis TaxID=284581 RepID=UPI001F5A9553|nr:hypothetical protein [Priestia koreensis]UNL82893.1 hypothetical protein IE339_11795 [Priestia koreensis]
MELNAGKKKSKPSRSLQTFTGLLSFLCGLLALAMINIGLLLQDANVPNFFVTSLPFIGLLLGVLGLFTKERSRLYAWWGIGINSSIFLFIFIMFGLAWTVYPQP